MLQALSILWLHHLWIFSFCYGDGRESLVDFMNDFQGQDWKWHVILSTSHWYRISSVATIQLTARKTRKNSWPVDPRIENKVGEHVTAISYSLLLRIEFFLLFHGPSLQVDKPQISAFTLNNSNVGSAVRFSTFHLIQWP